MTRPLTLLEHMLIASAGLKLRQRPGAIIGTDGRLIIPAPRQAWSVRIDQLRERIRAARFFSTVGRAQ